MKSHSLSPSKSTRRNIMFNNNSVTPPQLIRYPITPSPYTKDWEASLVYSFSFSVLVRFAIFRTLKRPCNRFSVNHISNYLLTSVTIKVESFFFFLNFYFKLFPPSFDLWAVLQTLHGQIGPRRPKFNTATGGSSHILGWIEVDCVLNVSSSIS